MNDLSYRLSVSRRLTLSLVLALLSLTSTAFASDAYVIRFSALGKSSSCHQAVWSDDVTFYNRTTGPLTVTLLGVSNGEVPFARPLVLQPRHATSALDAFGWIPQGTDLNNALWIAHLDVPAGVVVESRDVFLDYEICTPEHLFSGATGKVSTPVYRELVPANTEQVHLGTDLGSTPARQNVAIYNAGSRTATALISIYRGCDDAVLESRTVSIAPNTIQQFGGLGTVLSRSGCASFGGTPDYYRYVVVTVDQPSLSFVSSVTESQVQSIGNVVPLVELAVTINANF